MESASGIILLRTRNVDLGKIEHTLSKIDRCCKSYGENLDSRKLEFDQKDAIPRISCNISKKLFFKNYVKRRQMVILKGCHETWKAKNWTFKGIKQIYNKIIKIYCTL